MTAFPPYRRLIVAIVLPILVAGCSGKEARIQSHLEKGESYLAQSDLDKASIEIRNVLQMDPKQAQAYFLAGRIEESRNELRKAYANYSKALELNPTLYDAQAALGRLQLAIGADAAARKEIDAVLAKDPANGEALAVEAALTARQGHLDDAIRIANQATAGAHPSIGAATVLAGLYASKNDFAQAQAVIGKALAANPKDVTLLVISADLSRHANQDDQAVGFYERATSAAPKNYPLWKAWAEFDERRGKIADAEAVLRQAIKSVPDDSSRYLTLVTFLSQHQGEAAGLKELTTVAEARPRDYAVQFALAAYYKQNGKIDEARKILSQVEHNDGTGPSGLNARNQLALLDLAEGDEATARARLEEILKANPRDPAALLERGELELTHDQRDAAIADLRSVAKDKPDSARVLQLLAQAYTANGQTELARSTLSDAAKLFPNRPDVALLWIEYLSRSGHRDEALAAADDALRTLPTNPELFRIKADLQEQAKDLAGAETTLQARAALDERDARGPMLLGGLLFREKKYPAAIAEFDKAAELAPKSVEPRGAVLEVLIAARRFPEAHQRLEAAIRAEPERALNYQLDGNVYVAQGDNAAAETAYRKAIAVEPKAVTAYLNLANLLAKDKRNNEIVAVFQEGLKANPDDAQLLFAEADYYAKTSQFDAAIDIYKGLIARNKANVMAANNLAYLLTEVKGDPTSLTEAARLTRGFQFASDAGMLDTLGWVRYKEGQYADAVSTLQRAVAIAPHSQLLEFHYGMALYKAGDTAKGKEYLKDSAADGGGKLPDEARKILEG